MPELPEVETTRRGLEALITDKEIISVHVYIKKTSMGDTHSPSTLIEEPNHNKNLKTWQILID